MIVRTRWDFAQEAAAIWPLLCDARMEPAGSCLFSAGVPQPRECRLPEGGGAGKPRECVSDRGKIEQEILTWDEPRRLVFRMRRTDLYFRACVTGIEDDFELTPRPGGGTRVVRTTRVEIGGRMRWAKALGIWVGLKKVHRFVFRNWGRLAGAEHGATQ